MCSTRQGGVSQAPYDSLNLGDHVGDVPAAVHINRQRLAGALGARPVFLQQVHGWAVQTLDNHTADGAVADACITGTPGVACTVMVADCLPVLLAHRSGQVVAAAHAGWRGLLGQGGWGVLEATVTAICQFPGAQWAADAPNRIAQDLHAWLGPCIGPETFEVGPEVRAAFLGAAGARLAETEACFKPLGGGQYLADLPALARQRLQALGVHSLWGNDGSPDWCTVSQPSLYFSHRRDAARLGASGRFAAGVWLD